MKKKKIIKELNKLHKILKKSVRKPKDDEKINGIIEDIIYNDNQRVIIEGFKYTNKNIKLNNGENINKEDDN